MALFLDQLRLSRKSANEVQALMIRAQKPMATVPKRRTRVSDVTFRLARGQILTTVPAWLILPDRFASKSKLERQAFPKPPKAPGTRKNPFLLKTGIFF